MDQRISLITLAVADVGRSTAFYQALGWKRWTGIDTPNISFFQCGPLVVALYSAAALAADTGLDAPRPGGITLAVNMRSKDEVTATLDHAVSVGASLLKPATEQPWGGFVGYFADPDGHPWEVAWVPQFPLAEDGALILPG
ncbi:VOC family protein [Magnetospirillum moscoviense]|uniref:Glyoxalase n=1 Tax=Magnetospirillum moscoviense TaxID=1437059 RepID=A0A178MQZ2_9PROT|nr:VOC family protein [Magnetospirillum moscoviense]MBF0326517.1 VOC family protein [Alphaproteobacteria bacterium]OAN51479.1 glyoxalase [Magnetospirillum moscoviense]